MRFSLTLLLACTGCFDYAGLSAGYGEDAHSFPGDDLQPAPDLAHVDVGNVHDLDVSHDLALPCVQTLADVGTGDFGIAFRLTTMATVISTVLYQRSQCTADQDFWDIDVEPTGLLQIELGQGGVGYSTLNSTIEVNDGNQHNVEVTRASGLLSVAVDGIAAGSVTATWSIGALPTLGIASGNPCETPSTERPLVGTLADVCITMP